MFQKTKRRPVDEDPDPIRDVRGIRDRLAPFESVYDHVPCIRSRYGSAGRRVRIRWIAQSWEFDSSSSSCFEEGWDETGDDGWWIDTIRITGAVTMQVTPPPDLETPGPGACPSDACNGTLGDNGYDVELTAADADGNGVVVAGETVVLPATGTRNLGGCIDGITQYHFLRNGAVVQDWSPDATFQEHPVADAACRVQARCSVDTGCTSASTAAGANVVLQVYSGDGGDIRLSLRHDRGTGTTTVEFASRVQAPAIPQVPWAS